MLHYHAYATNGKYTSDGYATQQVAEAVRDSLQELSNAAELGDVFEVKSCNESQGFCLYSRENHE